MLSSSFFVSYFPFFMRSFFNNFEEKILILWERYQPTIVFMGTNSESEISMSKNMSYKMNHWRGFLEFEF